MRLIDIDATAPASATEPPRREPDDLAGAPGDVLVSHVPGAAPDSRAELTSALREHARLLRRRLGEHPDVAAQQAAVKLANAVVAAVTQTMDAVNAEIGDVVRVGLVLSMARPGVKRLGLLLIDKLNPKRRLECSLATSPRQRELVLSVDSLGRVAELARVGLQDGGAEARLRAAVEMFVLETAGRFAGGAGGPREGTAAAVDW